MTAPDPTYYKAGILVRITETRNDYPPVNAGQPLRYIAADNISFFSNEDAAELVALGRATYYDWEPSRTHFYGDNYRVFTKDDYCTTGSDYGADIIVYSSSRQKIWSL